MRMTFLGGVLLFTSTHIAAECTMDTFMSLSMQAANSITGAMTHPEKYPASTIDEHQKVLAEVETLVEAENIDAACELLTTLAANHAPLPSGSERCTVDAYPDMLLKASNISMGALTNPESYPASTREKGKKVMAESTAAAEAGDFDAACELLKTYVNDYRTLSTK